MFHITIITVGKLKERYYAAAADEYIRRLGAYCKFELIELPECRLPDDPNGTQIAAGLAREAEQIEAKLPRGAWFCVLTPEGTELSSEGLAERLQAEKLNGRSAACFLIGSSFGIERAHQAHGGFPPVVQQNDVPAPSHARHGARAALPRGEHPGRDEIS